MRNLRKFLDPEENPKVIYTDNSLEFGKPWKDLQWNHCASAPHQPGKNGIAQRAARKVNEGTSFILLQSGLDEQWWTETMGCYCFFRNVQDLLSDGKTLHERRFEEQFRGPIIPFAAKVEYHPISAKDLARLQLLDKKISQAFFKGYALYAEGEAGRETYS